MRIKTIIAAAIISTSAAIANAGGFDGPFVQLGIGGSGTSTKISGTDDFNNGASGSYNGTSSQGSVNGLVAAGWSQSVGEKGFNLAANLFYVIGNQNAGKKSLSDSGTWEDDFSNTGTYSYNGNIQNQLQGTFGISVEPGWNFTDSTLGYIKLAWVNTRMKSSANYSLSCTNDSGGTCTGISDSGTDKDTINGFGYGLGAKQLLTKNIFVGIDLMGVTYSSVNGDGGSAKPSQFMGFASIGYKF